MPPKVKTTKEVIVKTALDIVRRQGTAALNARTVASALGCSTQPIFSNFTTMDELRLAVAQQADALYQEYVRRETDSGEYPPYKAGGMAYIRFAKEEKELFKLLYMCDRSGEEIPTEAHSFTQMTDILRHNTGLNDDTANLFHLEMWAYVHGIATMFATGFLDLDWDLVSKMLTDAYLGLRKQYETEG
ncbi:MAG: TetR/AcrR family transcriptional regulator [Clostridia bacterium]|nr:TetR/AcrR family transcriptional regulator [Clostridia bacterium]